MNQERSAEASEQVFRRVLVNTGKLLGGRTVNAVISLGYTALAARALGVQPFGILVLMHAFAQLLGDVVRFQSWQTVLQYGAEPLQERRIGEFQRVIRFTAMLDVLSGVAGVAIGVAAALLFAGPLGWEPAQAPAAAAYATSVAIIVAAAPLGLLRLFDRFDILAGQAVVISLVRLAGCGLGLWLNWSLGPFLLVWAAGTLAGFLWMCGGAWLELRRRGLLEGFSWGGSYRIPQPGVWRFAWATNLNATLGTAFTHLVTLMVGSVLGPSQAALWRVGRQVADAIAKPAKLLVPALYPELARLRASSGEAMMWRLAVQIGLAAGGVGIVLLVVSTFAGAPLLRLILGAGFESAASLMTWQVAAAVVGLIALPLEPLVISLGHAGAAVRVRVVVAVCYAIALPPLVRRFGVEAAGASLLAASIALALGMLVLVLRRRGRSA
ncbi:lipopolysaccharide biosynthesis protein [Phenylobacterium deserti]|uniref:lipopolysaccharide biosynthesis protein n=1 Tax=Phenylobacterium deserti TaxID=1914756 RepID=UPI001F0B823B|nr:lipopolysaccharide biosynthesis protein [Phenylobacterium deserti]